MHFPLEYDQLSTLPVMCTIAIGLAIGWGIIMEYGKKKIYDSLTNTGWWQNNAIEPTKSMMANFGYPRAPTDKFPNAITESMARDFYAFLITICSQHFLSALPMAPVLFYGWEDSSDTLRSLFLIGTLSDLGFDIYDCFASSIRTFTKHPNPLPIDFWIIVVALHHTTALSLVLPMNLHYVHRFEYQQTAFSLLMAASLCYGLGCYKFALDIGKKKQFLLYKFLVLLQLAIILYTRVYLWFPAAISLRTHLREQNDTFFFYGASVMIGVFSLFNLILVADGFKAAIKCIPKKFPKTKTEKESVKKTFRRHSGIDAPGLAALSEIRRMMMRRKFKGAVHSIIAANRMGSSMSSGASGHNEKSD